MTFAMREQLAELARLGTAGLVTPEHANGLRARIRAGETVFELPPHRSTWWPEPPPPPKPRVRRSREKLTYNQVRHMRALARRGRSNAEIAVRFGVSASHVSKIISGRLWAPPPAGR